MFAPDPTDAIARLTDAYADIVALDNFARQCQGVQVRRIADEPDWFTQVAIEFRRLDAAADVWQLDRPLVWQPVLRALREHAAAFATHARLIAPGTASNAPVWVELLEQRLLPGAASSLTATRAADKELQGMIRAFGSVQPNMVAAIAAGLTAFARERQQMPQPSTRLALMGTAIEAMGSLQRQYLTLRAALPRLVAFWEHRQAALVQALAALKAGQSPELMSLPSALAAWQAIDAFVVHLAQLDVADGAPAVIDIGKHAMHAGDSSSTRC